jgi:hypothetical protein
LEIKPGYPDSGSEEKLNRFDNAAIIRQNATHVLDSLIAMRRFVQNNAIDGLITRVQDTHREKVVLARAHRMSRVKHERRLSTFMATEIDRVQPNVRQVIYGMEAKQVPARRIGMGLRLKLQPIPNDTVITGKGLLDDRWYTRGFRSGLTRTEPRFCPPSVMGIGSNGPSVIQGDHQRR